MKALSVHSVTPAVVPEGPVLQEILRAGRTRPCAGTTTPGPASATAAPRRGPATVRPGTSDSSTTNGKGTSMEIDEITELQHRKDVYESALKTLAQDRDALATKLECARNELAAVKDKFASAIAEYVELADRGIIRDSTIRELLKQLKAG